jgi:diaminopimelate epimerase
VRFVHERGLTDQRRMRVRTVNRLLDPAPGRRRPRHGRHGRPDFEHARIPFDARGLQPRREGGFELWPLALPRRPPVEAAVLSMGNPHAVQRVADVAPRRWPSWGRGIERTRRFPAQGQRRLPAGAGAHRCACACTSAAPARRWPAAPAPARRWWPASGWAGWTRVAVEVHTRGGLLRIEWAGGDAPVLMTGPAETVFEGEIEL